MLFPPILSLIQHPVPLTFGTHLLALCKQIGTGALGACRCLHRLQQWQIAVPLQSVRGLRVSYDLSTLPPAPEGFELFGTIHSHAGISAFHSGTDDRDEIHFDGLHITVGNLDKPSRSYACRWMLPDGVNPIYQKEIRSEIFGRGTLFLRLIIGSRAIKETATAENVRLVGLFRCGFHNA